MGNIARFRWRHILILFIDLLWVYLSFAVVFRLYLQFNGGETGAVFYLQQLPWFASAGFIIFYLFGLHQMSSGKYLHSIFLKSILSIAALTGASMLLSIWIESLAFPSSVYMASAAVQIVFINLFHLAIEAASRQWTKKKKVLIIGETQQIGTMLEQKLSQIKSYVVHDFIHSSSWKENKPRLAEADVILIQSDFEGKEEVMGFCALMKKEVLLVPELPELFILKSEVQHFDDLLVLSIRSPQLNLVEKACKRVIDILLSLTMLILTSPIFIILFIAIPLNSRGPALFKQTRSGLYGKEFEIFKFRSMVQDAEKLGGPELAKSNDPRITSIGRFIRATRLDELPQLINVLRGDMSLIGPRPERPFFVEQFSAAIPTYTYRMSVRPGITGLAQIMGKYSTSAADKHRFDLMYIREYSILLDIKILLQTLLVILSKDQAAGVSNVNTMQSFQKSVNEL